MILKHKVTINVEKAVGDRTAVIESTKKTIRTKLLDLLLGKKTNLLVIAPGDSVKMVEIKELREGGANHE